MQIAELGTELTAILRRYRRRLPSLDVAEKPDHTLLTEADLAVEALIVEKVRSFDPDARIIAEESGHHAGRPNADGVPDRIWVIDPIDGTAQFVRHDLTEFCTAVCLLERGAPASAVVVAPELGAGRTPLVLTATPALQAVTVNGAPADPNVGRTAERTASVTRSAGSEPRPFEKVMAGAGYSLKIRTTSQTLDMVRTALDLSGPAPGTPRFDLFFRRHQKIWDGLAGLCFGAAVGLTDTTLTGGWQLPVSTAILAQPQPTFESTVMGLPEAVEWFVEIAQTTAPGGR